MHMQIHTFYCLKSVIYSNHPQSLRFSIGCMLRAFLRAGRVLCIWKFPGLDRNSREVHGQWKKTAERKRERGNRQERSLCREAEYWYFLEKEQKGWTGTGEAGKKRRKHDRVCRRNRNGEGEVMLINPSCFLMFKNQTIYFISWIVFLKQDTFSCYSRLSVHNTWNFFNKYGYTLK